MRLNAFTAAGMMATAYGIATTTQLWPLGQRAIALPGDPSSTANVLSPSGEWVYGVSAAAMVVGAAVTMDATTYTATALAITANQGGAVLLAANRFTAAGQYGWFQVVGQGPVSTNGTFAAASAVFGGAAGNLSTTVAAGRQILGARSIVAQAATFTKANCKTRTGQTSLIVPDTAGLFAGLPVSGTGIAGGSVINDIDDGSKVVTLSAAMTANGNATTVTFTYTNFGGLSFPAGLIHQGQIT